MAFAAVAALAAAETVTASLVLGAMAEVGSAMSIVGAVTGNKDLAKLGGVIGIVGGVGSWVSNAASGAAGAASAGEAAGSAAAGGNAMDAAGFSSGTIDAAQSGFTSPATDFTTGVPPGVEATQSLAPSDAGMMAGGNSMDAAGLDGGVTAPAGATAPTEPAGVTGPAAVQDVGAKYATDYANGGPSVGAYGAQKGGNFFGNAWDFIKNPANKELVNMGAKVVGGVFEGMQRADEFDRVQGWREGQTAYQQARDANVRQQNKSRSGIIQGAMA